MGEFYIWGLWGKSLSFVGSSWNFVPGYIKKNIDTHHESFSSEKQVKKKLSPKSLRQTFNLTNSRTRGRHNTFSDFFFRMAPLNLCRYRSFEQKSENKFRQTNGAIRKLPNDTRSNLFNATLKILGWDFVHIWYYTLSDFKNATVGFYLVSEKLINHTTPIFTSCMVYHSYTTCQHFKKIYRLVFEKKWFNKKRFKTSFHIYSLTNWLITFLFF